MSSILLSKLFCSGRWCPNRHFNCREWILSLEVLNDCCQQLTWNSNIMQFVLFESHTHTKTIIIQSLIAKVTQNYHGSNLMLRWRTNMYLWCNSLGCRIWAGCCFSNICHDYHFYMPTMFYSGKINLTLSTLLAKIWTRSSQHFVG